MVRLIGAPALALTVVTAASPAAYAAHRYHYAYTVRVAARHVHHVHTSRAAHRTHQGYVAAAAPALPDRMSEFAQFQPRGPYAMSEETVERREPYRAPAERAEIYDRPRLGGRPHAWCGWYARSLVGQDPGPSFNLARNWAHWGHASSPGVGVMVVWSHHVGMITGRTASGEWIVKSGNDGHAVRERARSLGGAIAFRTS
ncbi:MAG TPA: hypothetical protein VLX44_01265 [Xanthobacteraceae bacterium]|nr:hypothetical protein [Xanthobacteraceae bacterium]